MEEKKLQARRYTRGLGNVVGVVEMKLLTPIPRGNRADRNAAVSNSEIPPQASRQSESRPRNQITFIHIPISLCSLIEQSG